MEEPARQNDLCNFRDCCRRRVLPAHGLHAMTPRPFQLIRIDCDALGTVLDFPEDAPGSPKIIFALRLAERSPIFARSDSLIVAIDSTSRID
jgi:hypothetical protein